MDNRTYKELQAFAKNWGFVISTAGVAQPGDGKRYGFYASEKDIEYRTPVAYAVGLKEARIITYAISSGIRIEQDKNKEKQNATR